MNNLIFAKNFSRNKLIIYFCVLITSGLVFRYIFFPYDIPLVLDSLGYFWYATDLSITNNFPVTHDLPNNFWPTFVSIFFSMSNSQDFMDYMDIQRNLSVIFSVLTSVPLYFLAKKFVKNNLALLVPLIFIFEPRIIENSFTGITEPFFIFFVTSSLALFFNSQKKLILLSFVLAGIFCLIRYEGLILTISMFGILFFRYRNEKRDLVFAILIIIVFLLVLTPMSIIRIDTMGYDGIFSHVGAGADVLTRETFVTSESTVQKVFPELGLQNFTKLFGWILIPTFTIFFPLGVFYFFKDRERNKIELILIGICTLIPAAYAFYRGISDVRYFFIIFPILTILEVYAIDRICNRLKKSDLIKLFLIIIIIVVSLVFFYVNNPDNNYEREIFLISKEINKISEGINASYYPEGAYLRVSQLESIDFPITSIDAKSKMIFVSSMGEKTIEEYIKNGKENGLTHLIIDRKFIDSVERSDNFLDDIFINEENYSYLIKEFDSAQEGFSVHVKIFRIDFEKFEFREKLD